MESLKRKNATFRTQWKFEIKNVEKLQQASKETGPEVNECGWNQICEYYMK